MMADKDIKEAITPFEVFAAKAYGLTPEEVHVAIKLGVAPQAIMTVKQTKWRDRQKQISEEGGR